MTLAVFWGLIPTAEATVLTSGSFAISSGAGGSGGGASSSCMIVSDGTSWSGGAVGVQGASSTKVGGGSPLAANVALKFDIGSFVDSLDASYGVGNWTVSNIKLTFQYTLYANNNRFGAGAGTFDVFWVANDSWVQGVTNPIYAANAVGLSTWSGGQALLGSEAFDWTTPNYAGTTADLTTGLWVTDKSGARQSILSYNLEPTSALLNDIFSAGATSNANLSLYLMATSDTVGLTIFTGGGSSLPTLSFDVVAVPEPGAIALTLFGISLSLFCGVRRGSPILRNGLLIIRP